MEYHTTNYTKVVKHGKNKRTISGSTKVSTLSGNTFINTTESIKDEKGFNITSRVISSLSKILFIVLLICVLLKFGSVASSSNVVNSTGVINTENYFKTKNFFDYMTTAPTWNPSSIINDVSSLSDNFTFNDDIRDPLTGARLVLPTLSSTTSNVFGKIYNFLVFSASLLYNGLLYLVWFIGYFFV